MLLGLLGGGFVTALILTERARRARQTVLDNFAHRRGLRCQREVALTTLAPLEPLGLLPPIVAVERLLQAPLPAPGRSGAAALAWAEVTLALCLAGNQRQPQRCILGVFPGSPDLPALRAGTAAALAAAPGDLGFVEMPATGMPDGMIVEAFQPLARRLTQTLGAALKESAAEFTVELRPGRILLALLLPEGGERAAAEADAPISVDALVALGLRLGPQLTEALAPAPVGPVLPPVLN